MIPARDLNQDGFTQTLIDLLERQQALVDELDVLSMQQAAHIAAQATDHLLDLLARRQTVIDEFSAGQLDVARMTQKMDERLASASDSQRQRVRGLVDAISLRLETVMARDQQDHSALRIGRDAVQKDMSGLGQARQARSAYAGTSTRRASNLYADRTG